MHPERNQKCQIGIDRTAKECAEVAAVGFLNAKIPWSWIGEGAVGGLAGYFTVQYRGNFLTKLCNPTFSFTLIDE